MSEVDYTSQILAAIDNAGLLERTDDVWELVIPESLQDYLHLPDLKDAPDDHAVFIDIDPANIPYAVGTDSPDELRRILDQYLKINQEELSTQERQQEVQHEVEHAEAAKLLGAESSSLVIEFYKSADGEDLVWQLVHYPKHLKTTKLGLAILAVYPTEPSEADLSQLRLLAYRDVVQVANLAKKVGLPIPLSARG